MKKCIVLSGHYRTFDTTWENIKKFIDINELDVYCHLWADTDKDESDRQLQSIIDKLGVPEGRIFREKNSDHEQTFLDMEKRILEANPKKDLVIQDRIAGAASMHYARKAAFNLIKEEYDVVVYCRYDIIFDALFKFDSVDFMVTPEAECYNLMSDIFALIPFKLASRFFLYDEYERLQSTQFEPEFEDWLRNEHKYGENNIRIHKYHSYNPHMLMLRHFIMTDTPYQIFNLPVRIR